MNIHFVTRTKGVFNRKARVTFRINSSEITTNVFPETELKGILAFASEIVRQATEQSTLIFHSQQNTFRDAFEKGWIDDWSEERFRSRPREHRKEWKSLYDLIQRKSIHVRFADLSETQRHALEQVLHGRRLERTTPGDPHENPRDDRTADLNNAIDRAVKKRC